MDNFGGAAIGKHLYDIITSNIPDNSVMLEFGSGPSTPEFTKHYTVYSVEQNTKYLNQCKESNYIYAPIQSYSNGENEYRWYDISILKMELPETYDFILVDGPQGGFGHPARIGFEINISLFNLNVPIFFDDTHRPHEYQQAQNVAQLANKELITLDYKDKEGCKFSYFI